MCIDAFLVYDFLPFDIVYSRSSNVCMCSTLLFAGRSGAEEKKQEAQHRQPDDRKKERKTKMLKKEVENRRRRKRRLQDTEGVNESS